MTSAEAAAALKGADMWDDFTEFRFQCEAEGMTKKKAYAAAIKEFGLKLDDARRIDAEDDSDQESSDFVALVAAAPASGEQSERADFLWVADHLDVPFSGIDPNDVPSRRALSRLKSAKTNPDDFWRSYDRLCTAKAEDEAERRRRSGDRNLSDIIDTLTKFRDAIVIESPLPSCTETVACQPVVSSQAD